ncbi:unnamed protein product [Calicophoron daubneyi]|uniref:Glucosamine 6-phosphate N-acetyltransferase n=1 Tax=Calicophoron daubneyi TaxID=300641 RepID=A0AAV2TWJ5_CALDB
MPCDGFGDTYLFNPKLLEAISINQIIQSNLTQKCPDFSESGCCVRPLKSGDFGYLNLLQELTEVGSVTQEEFEERFNRMAACPNTYFIILIEHKSTKQVLAAATLVAELKFIHECSKRGHIEDVVVRSNCRGKNFGKFRDTCGNRKTSRVLQDITRLRGRESWILRKDWIPEEKQHNVHSIRRKVTAC